MRAPQITSPYAPDLARVRVWIEQRISALAFVELVAAILALITRMAELNGELVKQLAHLTRRRPRSETLDRVQRQMTLPFGNAGVEPKPAAAATEKTRTSRRGRHPGRARPSTTLDRALVPNPVPADLRVCPLCGAEMTTVAHRACEIIDVIPAKVLVVVRLDETVACPNDDTIVTAEPPPQIVARGKLSDTLIVEALCDKYIEHQPIERQCARFSRAGADIAPQTLGRSVSACIDLLAPVASLIDVQTRGPGYLGTDATALRILDPDATLGVRNGAVWCWTNARWISFFYSPSGDADSVRRFLGDPRGRIVQCDGTSVTNFLEREGGKRPGCWSHGRRGLVVAARLGDSIALEGVRIIARLFVVEREAALAGDTADQRRERRREMSQPIVDELRVWLDDKRDFIPPKTPLGNALGYLHRRIGSGRGSRCSSTTATSSSPTTAASVSCDASCSAGRIGSSRGSTRAASAPRTSSPSSRPASRTTSTRAPTSISSRASSSTAGPTRSSASSYPIACSSRIPSSTSERRPSCPRRPTRPR